LRVPADQSVLSDQFATVRQALLERILLDFPHLLAVYAYGSRVRGGVHSQSDLDLALLLPAHPRVPAPDLYQLQGDLEAIAGMPVEVSVLNLEANAVHCKEVVAHGVPVFTADEQALAVFEMRALSNYARYCEDKRPVTAAYMEGHTHG
jgi:predicted nucleotidyltransferase